MRRQVDGLACTQQSKGYLREIDATKKKAARIQQKGERKRACERDTTKYVCAHFTKQGSRCWRRYNIPGMIGKLKAAIYL